MKIILKQTLFLSIILLVTSCDFNFNQRYFNFSNGYSVRIPDGWIKKEVESKETWFVKSEATWFVTKKINESNGGLEASILFISRPDLVIKRNDINLFFDSFMQEEATKNSTRTILTKGDAVIDTKPARWCFFYESSGNVNGLWYFVFSKKQLLMVQCYATPELYNEYKTIFKNILGTLKINE